MVRDGTARQKWSCQTTFGLMPLPPYAPELNSVENVWDYLRSNFLSHRVWETYDEIVDACCDAWKALMAKSEIVTSIGARSWAQVKI